MSTNSIHPTLARSYLVYFVFSIIGLFVDTFIGFTVAIQYGEAIALTCFFAGTALIMWAQYTSRHHETEKAKSLTPYFFRGPYRFARNPTQLGILILVAGYTVISGSLVFFGVTAVGYLISNIFFQKYETILSRTYDGAYEDYQTKVPKIF